MKNKLSICFLLLLLSFKTIVPSYSQELSSKAIPSHSILQQIRNHKAGTGIWWTGHNGWLIKSGDLLVSTDLALKYGGRSVPAPVLARDIAPELDIYLVTHGHSDHFDPKTVKVFIRYSKCIFVLPESTLKIAREMGIPFERIRIAKPREPFDLLGARIEPIRAIHGNANFAGLRD